MMIPQKLLEEWGRDVGRGHYLTHRVCDSPCVDGCTREDAQTFCDHDYCGKMKWIMERAKEYAAKLGTTPEAVLEKWEANRDYWYMNYYQECYQPTLKDVVVFESAKQFMEMHKQFTCPSCESTVGHPTECPKCGWKAYGFLGALGKGRNVYLKDSGKSVEVFAWKD